MGDIATAIGGGRYQFSDGSIYTPGPNGVPSIPSSSREPRYIDGRPANSAALKLAKESKTDTSTRSAGTKETQAAPNKPRRSSVRNFLSGIGTGSINKKTLLGG